MKSPLNDPPDPPDALNMRSETKNSKNPVPAVRNFEDEVMADIHDNLGQNSHKVISSDDRNTATLRSNCESILATGIDSSAVHGDSDSISVRDEIDGENENQSAKRYIPTPYSAIPMLEVDSNVIDSEQFVTPKSTMSEVGLVDTKKKLSRRKKRFSSQEMMIKQRKVGNYGMNNVYSFAKPSHDETVTLKAAKKVRMKGVSKLVTPKTRKLLKTLLGGVVRSGGPISPGERVKHGNIVSDEFDRTMQSVDLSFSHGVKSVADIGKIVDPEVTFRKNLSILGARPTAFSAGLVSENEQDQAMDDVVPKSFARTVAGSGNADELTKMEFTPPLRL